MKNGFARIVAVVFCSSLCLAATGQDSASALRFSGYGEVYYSYDFDNPATHEKPFFLYNHKRHNEVNVNLAFVKASYSTPTVRSNLALMTGTYAQYNLAAEPDVLQYVYEANVGIRVSQRHNLWLDAGILPSHIGFESAVAADCWTPSRSLVAENSPYYEAGIKLTSTNKKETFQASVLFLNGWQRMQRPTGINKPSFGLQVNFKPVPGLVLNYSNFLGTDKPDSLRAFRTYHNMYAIHQLNKNWGVTAGFDIGTDKNESGKYACWYTPVLIVRRTLGSRSFAAFRSEYFRDKKETLLKTNTRGGFEVIGFSLNYDYAVAPAALARIEWKSYVSDNEFFRDNKTRGNHSVLLTLSVKL